MPRWVGCFTRLARRVLILPPTSAGPGKTTRLFSRPLLRIRASHRSALRYMSFASIVHRSIPIPASTTRPYSAPCARVSTCDLLIYASAHCCLCWPSVKSSPLQPVAPPRLLPTACSGSLSRPCFACWVWKESTAEPFVVSMKKRLSAFFDTERGLTSLGSCASRPGSPAPL